ncbi:MAG: 4Fe-4S binding protein [Clostridia bacterium]|nr:4Fe-4S binding protein [Clostridia bacterium]
MAYLNKTKKSLLYRGGWYILGFFLFYAPFALIQRVLTAVLPVSGSENIHGACFRMGIGGLITGKGLQILTTTGILLLLILISAFIFGPLFCGKLCLAGAVSEYLSRLVPSKLKFDWQKHLNPVPVRYGMLAGFLAAPFFQVSVVCAFCNFSFMERLILSGKSLDMGVLGSAGIITAFLWLIVFGAFAKGGRGFCSYICPVGAVQSLLHFAGSRLGFTMKLRLNPYQCVQCKLCEKECPTGCIRLEDGQLQYEILNCITCGHCKRICPKNAISYKTGKANWGSHKPIEKEAGKLLEV